jgi:predicted MPP superfamily phosphohydrolase
MKPAFIIFMAIVILLANVYVFYRFWCMIPPNIVGRILLVVSAVSIISAPFLGNLLSTEYAPVLERLGTSWFFFFVYFLIIFILFDVCRITGLFPVEKLMYNNWKSFITIIVVVSSIMAYGYFNYYDKKRVELSITDKRFGTDKAIKIVLASDFHLGDAIGAKELEQWIGLINKETPDIVLIAGDIVNSRVRPLYEQKMDSLFKQIRSKYGVYTIMGNHEYRDTRSVDFIRDANIHLLRDSAALIDNRFYVVGREDKSNTERKPLEELTAGLDPLKPIILLDHQPNQLEEAEKNNICLQLSGHTHHGQIWPLSLITQLIFEKAHGYLKKGNSHFYVTSGIGIYGGKFRIGTQSEYVVINLKPE